MPIEREPKDPLPEGHVPPDGVARKVSDVDSWKTLAKEAGMSVWDLIFYNFATRSPAEVNWYLHRDVGCTKATKDGKNWIFSSDANPGTIYLPPAPSGPVGKGEYKMKAGDDLVNVAHDHGHLLKTVWEHSKNKEVKDERKEPHLVRPEDRVHLPPVRLREKKKPTEKRHQFRRKERRRDLGALEVVTDFLPGEIHAGEHAFTLTGKEGAFDYEDSRSARDDFRPGDKEISLLFVGLPKDAKYALKVRLADGEEATVFEDVTYEELTKQSDGLSPETQEPD